MRNWNEIVQSRSRETHLICKFDATQSDAIFLHLGFDPELRIMPGWGTDAPVTSQEQADLDDMGEKVLHESTFPAAPLVRPPVLLLAARTAARTQQYEHTQQCEHTQFVLLLPNCCLPSSTI